MTRAKSVLLAFLLALVPAVAVSSRYVFPPFSARSLQQRNPLNIISVSSLERRNQLNITRNAGPHAAASLASGV